MLYAALDGSKCPYPFAWMMLFDGRQCIGDDAVIGIHDAGK